MSFHYQVDTAPISAQPLDIASDGPGHNQDVDGIIISDAVLGRSRCHRPKLFDPEPKALTRALETPRGERADSRPASIFATTLFDTDAHSFRAVKRGRGRDRRSEMSREDGAYRSRLDDDASLRRCPRASDLHSPRTPPSGASDCPCTGRRFKPDGDVDLRPQQKRAGRVK